jgi:putative ABC transport system permease protein
MARRFWPDQDPIGRRVRLDAFTSAAPWLSVVGIVPDIKRFWWDREPTPTAYVPYRQAPEHTMSVVIRTSSDPALLLPSAQSEVRFMDPELPIYHVETLEQSMTESVMGVRLASGIMTAFAALALLLSAMASTASSPTPCSGRRARSAFTWHLGRMLGTSMGMVMREGVRLAAVAIAIGLAASFALSRMMASLLFGVVAENPLLLLALPLPLVAAALVATYLPARRAAAIDPIVALRHE